MVNYIYIFYFQRKRQKTRAQYESIENRPVQYPLLDEYHEMGFENFTAENIRQLHENVNEPVQESPADRPSNNSVSNPEDHVPI